MFLLNKDRIQEKQNQELVIERLPEYFHIKLDDKKSILYFKELVEFLWNIITEFYSVINSELSINSILLIQSSNLINIMFIFMIFLTCFLKTKAQYVTRTTFLIMDFPALFLVILAIYLYGIRPHSYIYTFKSKGSRSRKSYFALFPSLHFHRQVQFIVIATTSGAAARKEIVFGAKSICRKTDILRNCDA